MNTNDLVVKAQRGDQKALLVVLAYFKRKIHEKLFKTWEPVQGGPELDDMVQLCLMKVLKGIKNFNPNIHDRAFTWLWLYADSAVKEEYRNRNYIKRSNDARRASLDAPASSNGNNGAADPGTIGQLTPARNNVESEVIDNLNYEIIYNALTSRLTHVEITVLACSLSGCQNRDIAQETGLPLKTIDNAKQRIKAKTRKLLEEGLCNG